MKLTKKSRQRLSKPEAERILRQLWSRFNHLRFQGRLKEIKISLTNKPLILGVYQMNLKNKKRVDSQILISETLFYRGSETKLIDTLLHEMSHQYCSEYLGLINEKHGPAWRKTCNMSGAVPRARFHARPTPKFNLEKKYWDSLKKASVAIPQKMKIVRWLHPGSHRWLDGICLKKIQDYWVFLWFDENGSQVKWSLVHYGTLFNTTLTPAAQRKIKNNVKELKLSLDF